MRDPALDVGTASRFDNACINLIPASLNIPPSLSGLPTDLQPSHAEGFYCNAGNGSATQMGLQQGHFYNCVFTWNAADGFRIVRIGQDDRYYHCIFSYNGYDTNNQGIHNSSTNPGGVRDGVGGRSYFENCEASYNMNRGWYMGTAESAIIRNCTAIGNGTTFPGSSNTCWGLDFIDGQGYIEIQNFFGAGNKGGTIQANVLEERAGSETIIRNVISLSNGIGNTSLPTDAFNGLSAVRWGGQINVIEDVYVDNCPAIGLWADAEVTVANMNIQIRRCLVRNCGQTGLLIWRTGTGSTVVLENLQLENTSYNPLASTTSVNRGNAIVVRAPGLSNDANFTINNVGVDGAAIGNLTNQGNGIRVEATAASTGNLSVSNVDIRNCSNNGLSLAGGNISLTNAKITNVLNCGVEIAAASPVTMATVEVIGAVNHGITLGQETEGTPSTPLLIGGLEYLSLVNCATSGVRVFSNQINSPAWTLDHTTIFNCGSGFKMQATNFQSQPVDIQNTIIAGTGKTGIDVVTTLTSPITVHHSGLVQQGVYALGTSVIDVNNPSIVVLGSNVVTADPVFAGVTPGLPDFLDVRSTAYGGQGTGGSNLSGRWDYIGDFVNIEAWRRF
ncbi:hypothetical protein HS125_03675 [bacterium]|nr:hypothetical protein [bacterium]